MPQTRGQFFDDISRLFSDAAGLADNARREVETLGKAQLEKLLSTMNVVGARGVRGRARDGWCKALERRTTRLAGQARLRWKRDST